MIAITTTLAAAVASYRCPAHGTPPASAYTTHDWQRGNVARVTFQGCGCEIVEKVGSKTFQSGTKKSRHE
jgi:hypothetical protein